MEQFIPQIVTVLSSVVFFFLGSHSTSYDRLAKRILLIRKLRAPAKKGMVVDYPTPEELEYRGSEQEQIDKKQTELLKNAGL